MHYHMEVVIPPMEAGHIEAAIKRILKPYTEHDDYARNAFYDWYVIGGRFAGRKLELSLDQEKLQEFMNWCVAEEITVSGLHCGKQEINPPEQIPKVDAKWNEMFPHPSGEKRPCHIFRHSNDPYASGIDETLDGDISLLADSKEVDCERVIFAGPAGVRSGKQYDWTGPMEVKFMICREIWNGTNHVKTTWDGTVSHALEMFLEKIEAYTAEYQEVITPRDDWLVVTVDYHS